MPALARALMCMPSCRSQPSTPELQLIASATLLPGCFACCSRECQVAHWPQHRAACKGAQASRTKPDQRQQQQQEQEQQ